MATTVLLVDDSDVSRITYDPPSSWSNQGSSSAHNSTMHGLTGQGTITFTFNGTGVAAYGTIPRNTSWSGVKCNIDGKSDYSYSGPSITTSANDPIYNFEYCTTGVLILSDDQEHILTITADPSISNTSNNPNWLYLDYISYNYPSHSSSTNAPLAVPSGTPAYVLVDDGRTDLIKYDGPNGAESWNVKGGSYEYQHTAHSTTTGGATATFEFTDGGSPVHFDGKTAQTAEFQTRFFQSNILADGKHTLVITSTTEHSLEYFLDYIVYTTSNSELNSTTSGNSSSPSAPTQSPTATSTSTTTVAASKPKNTGLIAGVSVAAVLIVLIGIAGFVFLMRKRRRSASGGKYNTATTDLSSLGPPTSEAFTGDHTYQGVLYSNIAGSETQAVSSSGPSASVIAYGDSRSQHTLPSAPSTPPHSASFVSKFTAVSPASSTTGLTSSGALSRLAADNSMGAPRPVVQYQDGGMRLSSAGGELGRAELPPVYQNQY